MGSLSRIINSRAEHIRAQAGIDAARITQKSGNEKRVAQAAAAETSKSIGNRRIMDAAGDQIGAINENIVRNLDASVRGTLSQRVAAAEDMGRTVAGAAAAGVGGSSVDIYKATMSLNNAFNEDANAQALASDQYAAGRSKSDTLTNAVNSLDNSRTNANLDFTQYVDHKEMNGLTKILALSTAAAATYVSGNPTAGFAVLDGFQGQQDIVNGDFASGGKLQEQALMGAMSTWKTATQLAKPGKVFGRVPLFGGGIKTQLNKWGIGL